MAAGTERRRQKIFESALETASEIVAREESAGLETRQIAAEIGVSVDTLYNVVGNLETLILHLNGRTFDEAFDTLAGFRTDGGSRAEALASTDTYLPFCSGPAHAMERHLLSRSAARLPDA